MEPDTHRNDHGWSPRTTDYARALLHKAQIALALLAVPLAAAVGFAVAGWAPATTAGPAAAGVVLRTVSEIVTGVDLLPTTSGSVGALARAEEIAQRVPADAADGSVLSGVLAGLSTLGICWALLATGTALWRRRLVERDLRDWAAGWAQVEPLWSDRIT